MNYVNMYSYRNRPLVNNGKYDIYPLDDNGLNKYLYDKDSHNRIYNH